MTRYRVTGQVAYAYTTIKETDMETHVVEADSPEQASALAQEAIERDLTDATGTDVDDSVWLGAPVIEVEESQ